MTAASPTISLRLPQEARDRLDRATIKTRRSRSFLMQRALEKHLDDIEREETAAPMKRLSVVLGLAGAGASPSAQRSTEEIDAHIRWLRDHG
jgi:predicted DNA-binding protein